MEWEEVDPGRKKREIHPRETARRGCGARHFCHLAIAGAGARPRPGPARRGESPAAAAAPPHALPRRPRARGRPGQVAAVPGSGWPGAAASERGGGQRRIVVRLGPARAGRAGRAGPGAGQPRADPLAPLPPERSPWELSSSLHDLLRFIPLGLARRKGTAFCSWLPRRSVFVFEVLRNGRRRGSQLKSEDIIRAFCSRGLIQTFFPWHSICFTSPAPPLSLVWNPSLFAV